ncbi:uncharacterized protein LOC141639624 [Silene latifolia]|uniref:uncharacterized protein LOC141639624 n=1 Tax=Silene latifolia TaxID=37657 RepID=UPI003D77F29B
MTEVAKAVVPPSSLPMDSLPFCGTAGGGSGAAGGGGASVNASRPLLKRKTPSQLRGEQLKRKIAVEVPRVPSSFENTSTADTGTMKLGLKNTRYVEKRLDEVYQARKPTSKLDVLTQKTGLKDSQVTKERIGLKSSFSSNVTLKSHRDLYSKHTAAANVQDSVSGQCPSAEKESHSKFRSVAELSLGFEKFSEQGSVDVDKAFKGLAARETSGSCSPPSSAGKCGDVKSTLLGNFGSEILVPGRKVPLDFTLKTAIRIVSSSPVDRLHRLFMCGTYNGMTPFSSQSGCSGNLSTSSVSNPPAVTESCLHSWIYPQSSLPASVISVLSSSNGGAEMDFLGKRQLAWEDSFRSLYYMLRKSGCNIFYVCASQFVVMFTAADGMKEGKRVCNAYISQSTRGLRSLLREHDISYSMPFCSTEVEQISREDLVELSEIEKQNLGQAKRMSSMPDVDSSPKSLLAVNGNENVHGLYDFLLNYRSLLTMLSNMDVPVLCGPLPFVNAALSSPEVKCKEIKRADYMLSKGSATKDGGSIDGSKGGVSYSIELKGSYLPPWIVSSVCSAMSSEGKSFEASFTTEPNSMGLNAALEVNRKFETDKTSGDSQEVDFTFGIPATVVTYDMHKACLKGLKYADDSQVASLSPI